MYPALVVSWLASPVPAELPPEVTRWAARRGFRAEMVQASADVAYAEEAALEIESLLEEARSSASGAAPLQRLDQLLEQHPELPQAAWWLAERHALARQSAESGRDPALAARLELRRAALEGPRADTAVGVAPARASAPPATAPLELSGLRPRDQLLLDGEQVNAGAPMLPGRHHAQLFRAGRRVWASWVELDSAELQIPEASAPCAELDLLGTEYAADAPRPAPGVACTAWAVAHSRAGGLELALCRRDRCEPWQSLGSPARTAASAGAVAEPPEELPAWLTWGALGLGVAASTALVLWQAGAFDRSPPATEFVFTGPSAAAVRF